MTAAFDPRVIQVTILLPNETLTLDGGLSIYASGIKTNSSILNQCEIRIINVTKEHRNYILTRLSPLNLNNTPVRVFLDVGRESYGIFRLFDGYVLTTSSTQPPDIGIILTAVNDIILIGDITQETQPESSALSTIAKNIATKMGKILNFEATDKQIENYIYNGCVAYEVQELENMGDVVVSTDNDILTVRNANTPSNAAPRIINASTGMVGIPAFIWNGVRVTLMIDNTIKLGNVVTIESEMLPAANGDYVVVAIRFEVASRDQPFFYILECMAKDFYLGTQ